MSNTGAPVIGAITTVCWRHYVGPAIYDGHQWRKCDKTGWISHDGSGVPDFGKCEKIQFKRASGTSSERTVSEEIKSYSELWTAASAGPRLRTSWRPVPEPVEQAIFKPKTASKTESKAKTEPDRMTWEAICNLWDQLFPWASTRDGYYWLYNGATTGKFGGWWSNEREGMTDMLRTAHTLWRQQLRASDTHSAEAVAWALTQDDKPADPPPPVPPRGQVGNPHAPLAGFDRVTPFQRIGR